MSRPLHNRQWIRSKKKKIYEITREKGKRRLMKARCVYESWPFSTAARLKLVNVFILYIIYLVASTAYTYVSLYYWECKSEYYARIVMSIGTAWGETTRKIRRTMWNIDSKKVAGILLNSQISHIFHLFYTSRYFENHLFVDFALGTAL